MHNRVLLLWAAVLLAITAARDNQTSDEIAQLIKDEFAELKSQIGAERDGRAMCRQPWNGLGKAACAFTDTGAPWTVIQRRTKGDVSFSRGWKEYEQGFGDITGDYWIGLKAIYELCPQNHPPCEVRFDFTHYGKIYTSEISRQASGRYVAIYSTFRISPSWFYYKLDIEHFDSHASTATDEMSAWLDHQGKDFSTIDIDRDEVSSWNCAEHHGGWWFSDCGRAWLNGPWNKSRGLYWLHLTGLSGSLTSSQISVRLRT